MRFPSTSQRQSITTLGSRALRSLILCSQAWILSAEGTWRSHELLMPLDIVLKNYVVPESLTWASKTMSYTEPSQGVLTSSVLLNKIINNNNNNNSKYNEKITIINKNKFPELLYHNGKNFIIFCDPIKTCKLVNVSCGQLRLLVII